MLKKLWFQTHWLIGITAGMVLAVVGATGALLSFESDLLAWLNSDVRSVQIRPEGMLTPKELVERVQAGNPDKRILALNVSSDPEAAARVTFAFPPGADRASRQGPPGRGPRGEMHYVDPYTGSLIIGDGNKGETFFRTTREIHRWLTAGELGDRDIGRQIVGASTVLLVVLALSGLYLRWPRRASDWRTWLTFDFALKGRSFLWHLHAVAGTWVLVLYLVMSLTGLYWSYEWYRDGLYAITGAERPANARGARPRGEQGARDGSRTAVADNLAVVWPTFQRTVEGTGYSTANLDLSHADRVEIRYLIADPPHERAFNTVAIDAANGVVTRHETYAEKPLGAKLMASIFPLHSGSFFGLPGLVVFMLASLAMPVFAVTGWMLYLDRRKKKYAARAAAREAAAVRETAASRAAAASPGGAGAGTGGEPGIGDAMQDLLIGFASQAGFARQLAWQTAGSLQAAGVNVQVCSLSKLGAEQLARFRRALFVVSTFGDGEPPDEARAFERRLMSGSLPLRNLRFGLLALGDRQFRTYCAFGRALESWLRRQGAEPLFPRVDVDSGRPEALAEWRQRLGVLTGRALPAWAEPRFDRWRLAERRLLNEGSAGEPMFHIELEPPDPALLSWKAGDIAEIRVPASEPVTREFSIASLPEDGRIHLVVRQARREDGTLGAGSGWLTALAPAGGTVELRIRSNPSFHAPSGDGPLILIGNGTGIAGLRSHLKARARLGRGRAWLIFGERNARFDSLYGDEIEAWRNAALLERADLVFSRDQPERLYVQDLLRARADDVREWIEQGAAILVCGSLQGMAPGVDVALREILGDQALTRLTSEGRYRRDVY